jgi:hypothetical protein
MKSASGHVGVTGAFRQQDEGSNSRDQRAFELSSGVLIATGGAPIAFARSIVDPNPQSQIPTRP